MRTIFSTLAVLALASLALVGQDGAPKGKAPKAPPKNLKVLPADNNLIPAMQGFVAALGLADKGGCNFCHEMDRSLDTKPEKVMAREMIQMVMDINARPVFKTKPAVTCFTCHRGSEHPLTAPPTP
ncbi:MAG: photosynthetic reaction center cytochrome c subunit family protein [Acidobacteriota bacterium]